MSVATAVEQPKLRRLASLPTSSILASDDNPREHLPEEELDRLTQSIAKEGILVPVVVYPEGRYRLIDGERRWRAAKNLGLDKVPALITDPPSRRENLERMFNVHHGPGAMAGHAYCEGFACPHGRETRISTPRELSDLTGLNPDRIRRLQHAMELPAEYQKYIDDGVIPLNFFWELKRNVIDPLAKKRPALWEEFTETDVVSAFVEKRLAGTVTDPVSFRRVLAIINMAGTGGRRSARTLAARRYPPHAHP